MCPLNETWHLLKLVCFLSGSSRGQQVNGTQLLAHSVLCESGSNVEAVRVPGESSPRLSVWLSVQGTGRTLASADALG